MKDERGQAIFELIIFMPIFLYMVKILFDYGDSINNSINQNKVIRGYYFYTISNDSNAPNFQFINDYYDTINGDDAFVGQDSYAWSLEETTVEQIPKGSCVRLPSFLGNDLTSDECLDPDITDRKTRFVRSYTAFGICTGSWRNKGSPGQGNLYFLDWENAATNFCNRVTGQ